MPKKISVNLSTLVDLKAELFRKQEEAKRQKQDRKNDPSPSTSALYVKGAKPLPFARKIAAAEEKKWPSTDEQRKRDDYEAEQAGALARSRERLEAKAKLYEKLQNSGENGATDSDGTSLYLVNFERKAYEGRPISDEEDDSDSEIPSTSQAERPDEGDWVEYTDVLGRTRKCLRHDLPNFVAADEKLKKRVGSGRDDNESCPSRTAFYNEQSDLLSEDMRRELKRKAWEREEEEAANTTRGPVHYQHVSRDETREHGVGYFAFATDEQTRNEQMHLLDELRQQTLSQRDRSQKLKEKRDAALKARLDKVRERKNLKLESEGLPGYGSDDSDQDPVAVSLQDIPLPSETMPATKEDVKSTARGQVRPWDVGKPRVPQENWVDKRRRERQEEFAPPTFYK